MPGCASKLPNQYLKEMSKLCAEFLSAHSTFSYQEKARSYRLGSCFNNWQKGKLMMWNQVELNGVLE